ncbi:hypothetical protein J6590_081334 [Homalodisca vitripennis]|nr:hypothetical protein J6590_081334 [Homalodisca vitripennis]
MREVIRYRRHTITWDLDPIPSDYIKGESFPSHSAVNQSVTMVLGKDVECYDSSGTLSYLSNSDWRHDVNQFSVPRDHSQRTAASATSSFIINFRPSEIELRNPLCLMLA